MVAGEPAFEATWRAAPMPAEDVGRRSPDTTASRAAAGNVNTLSDAHLLPAAQADPLAFAPLYERYVDRVYRYCLRRLGDEDEAADATSLIFTRVLAALPRFQPSSDAGGSFRAWLFTIAHRVVVDVYRGAGRAPTSPLDDETGRQLRDRDATPEEQAVAGDERARVERAGTPPGDAAADRRAPAGGVAWRRDRGGPRPERFGREIGPLPRLCPPARAACGRRPVTGS